MQTNLIPLYQDSSQGQRAEEILRSCVHCGFCNATCPTYQVLGDELDGPRGRIYQIKQLLEGGEVSDHTREHLDRCLSCRACETTCPSGVQYHELLDIGKQALDQKLPRKKRERLLRSLVHAWLIRPKLFSISMRLGRWLRSAVPFLLPAAIKSKVVEREKVELPNIFRPDRHAVLEAEEKREQKQGRGVLLVFDACVQDAITPQVNQATKIVFESLGFSLEFIGESSVCCGALSQHTDQQVLAKQKARQNIDAWMGRISTTGAQAIIATASGCGVFIKDYPELFDVSDPYFAKAQQIAKLCKDPVELFSNDEERAGRVRGEDLCSALRACISSTVMQGGEHDSGAHDILAYHPPCTLQHGQKLQGAVEALFERLSFPLLVPDDAHLCCGSAGTYSLLQPKLSSQLQENKLQRLNKLEPTVVLSANIGCQAHLASKSEVPVVHWLQYLAQMLTSSTKL